MQDKKLNVLVAIDVFLPDTDGVINCVKNYATYSLDRVNMTIIAPKNKPSYKDDFPYRVVRCSSMFLPVLNYYYGFPMNDPKFIKEIRSQKYDIVHIHSPFNMGKFAYKIAKEQNIPVVTTMHLDYRADFEKYLNKSFAKIAVTDIGKLYKKMDELFVCSPMVENEARGYSYDGKISYLPFGTELKKTEDTTELVENANKIFNLDKNTFVCFYVGRLVPLKRVDFILEALSIVKSKGYEFKFYVVGKGEELRRLKSLAKKLGLAGFVKFLGFIPREQFPILNARADLLLFPSTYNTCLVKIESATYKTAGLFIKDSRASDGVVDGQNGFVSEDNVEDFANKIMYAIDHKQDLERIGQNAQDTLYYSWQDATDKLIDKYYEIVNNWNGRPVEKLKKTKAINKDIIFVDCFNTIIFRKKSDKDILFEWAKCIGKKYEIDPVIFFKLLMQVRKITFSKIIENKTEMLLIDSIKKIAKILGLNIINFNEDEFITFAYKSYIETESKFHYVKDDFITKLRQYKAEGKKIYMISDFYCTSDILKIWLGKLHVLDIFDDIYVSCEYNCAKYNGSLYSCVLNDLNIKAKEVLMIGDHIHSDNFMANCHGIKSERRYSKVPKNIEVNHRLLSNGINYKNFKQMIKPNDKQAIFANYSILYTVFCKKLFNELIKTNVKDVFFLAREGKFLKRLFDGYLEVMREKNLLPYEIKTHYLLVSRNSVFNACLKDLSKEKFTLLFDTFRNLSITSFLCSLNFTKEERQRVMDSLDINAKKIIFNLPESKEFIKLKNDSEFIKIYNNKIIGSHEAFGKYLNSFGVDFYKDGMVMVDSGWNGTMQGLIDEYFERKVKLKGYYIGCKKAKSKYLRNLDKQGLMFDFVHRNPIGNFAFSYMYLSVEQLCGADHERVNAYKLDNNGQVQIIYDDNKTDIEMFNNYLKDIQDGIYEKFISFAKADYANLSYLLLNTNALLPSIINNKTRQEKDFEDLALQNYNNGFGVTGNIFGCFGKFWRSLGFRVLDGLYMFFSLFRQPTKKYYDLLLKDFDDEFKYK